MMGNCRAIEMELAAYCSGELAPAERNNVRKHLDRCSRCRAELALERNLRTVLGTLPAVQADGDIDRRIIAAVRTADTGSLIHRNRGRRTAGALLVAATLAVALLVPALRPAFEQEQTWTEQEIATARREALYSLALTAKVLERSQKDAVVEVFGNKLPAAVNESLKIVKQTTSGGNG